ncbi:polysaccharide biosynthesis/export family protein [Candidatus Venteria ishoeyi]|nr:polysaccharide biosynthesis/export family protein [Candidatus Venteria ishoeyi]
MINWLLTAYHAPVFAEGIKKIELSTAESVLSSYHLGSGDKIKIHVFGEDELSTEVRLSDAGTISYTFLGELQVKGLTTGQLQNKITSALDGDYLINPRVSVTVLEYRQFFIHGEVKQPGGYPYIPGLTIRKAVSIAGGFTDYASENVIGLIQESDKTRKEQKVTQDSKVLPGDIINIKESLF